MKALFRVFIREWLEADLSGIVFQFRILNATPGGGSKIASITSSTFMLYYNVI